jgi:hypothetical protein
MEQNIRSNYPVIRSDDQVPVNVLMESHLVHFAPL